VEDATFEPLRAGLGEGGPDLRWILVAAALAIGALGLSLRPGPSPNARLRPAAMLVLLGLLVATQDVVHDGTDLRLPLAGLALATLGTAVCARSVRGPVRLLTPAALLVATLALAALELDPGIADAPQTRTAMDRLRGIRDGGLVAAFATMPLLAWALIREYRLSLPRRFVRRLFLAGVVLGVVGGVTFAVIPWVAGRAGDRNFEVGRIGEVAVLAGLVILAYVLARKRTFPGEHERGGSRIRKLPRGIRLLGSPPAALIALAGVVFLTDAGGAYLARSSWASRAPGAWIAMGAVLFTLLLAAHRASNVPPPWRRIGRRSAR
jgi:hypothetical protein